MNREQKTAAIESMNQDFSQTPHVFLTGYRGMTVNQSSELRRKIRAAGGSYRVVKNRLARRAASGNAVDRLAAQLRGPCALAAHRSDPVGMAKLLIEFAKENPQLQLVAAVVDGRELVNAEGIKALSTMPGLPELRAQILAMINTPATMLLRLMNTPGSQLARVVDARRDALGGGGGDEPAAAPAES